MVYLIGVGHSVQCDIEEFSSKTISFVKYLELKVKELDVVLIAEEFSEEELSANDIPRTITQKVAEELNVEHRLCDPNTRERERIGWKSKADDDKRREFWFQKIKDKTREPIIFVCGGDHLKPFALLLRNNGVRVRRLSCTFILQLDINKMSKDRALVW